MFSLYHQETPRQDVTEKPVEMVEKSPVTEKPSADIVPIESVITNGGTLATRYCINFLF